MKTDARLLLTFLLLFVLLTASPSALAQTSEEQLDRVFGDWQKRQERIKRIHYTVRGQSIIPKGTTTDDYGRPVVPPDPAEDVVEPQNAEVWLDFPKQRFRLEFAQKAYSRSKKQLFPSVGTSVFDGATAGRERPRQANTSSVYQPAPTDPDIYVSRNYARNHPLQGFDSQYLSPLLMAHGLVPRFAVLVSFGKLPDRDDFAVHGRAVHAGKPCLVLRTYPERNGTQKSYDEYWIDTSHDSAIVRHSSYVNDKLLTDIDIIYQQTAGGWLPLRWTGITRLGNQPINVTRWQVDSYALEPVVSDDDFRVHPKPGDIIHEETFDESGKAQDYLSSFTRKLYRVGADGRWHELDEKGVEKKHPWNLWYWLGASLLAIVACALGWRYWKRRRLRAVV